MKKVAAISLCLCVVGAVAVLAAGRYKPLDATYAITGATIIDPDPEEKKDRVSIYIDGDAAREIYKAMSVPEEPLPCDDDKSPNRQKSAGGLTCFHHDKDDAYGCGVAIKLDDGTTKNALAC